MKKLLLTSIALLIFTGSPLAQVRLWGYVNDTGGAPLQGATLLIADAGKGAISGVGGYFSMTLPDTGDFELQASYLGYRSRVVRLHIAAGETEKPLRIALKESPVVLQTLTLKATRYGEETPFTTGRIHRKELQEKNLGQDMPYLLDELPSVVVTSDAGAGVGYTGIRIRGTDPTRINVTINGVPLNDAESQGVFWVDLPDLASSVADVQVERGVGTATNGPGAFGATINLNSSLLEPVAYTAADLAAGSFNTRRVTFRFGSGLIPYRGVPEEGFSLDGRLSYIGSDGYIDRARADLRSWFLSGAFIGGQTALRFNAFSGSEETYQAWNGVPAQWVHDDELRRYNTAGTEKPGLPYEDEVDDYTQTHYQLHLDRKLNNHLNLGLTGFYTRGFGFFEQYKAGELRSRYLLNDTLPDCCYDFVRRRWLDNHFFGMLWSLSYHSPDSRTNLTLGGVLSRYLGDHYGELLDGAGLLPEQFGHRYYFSDAAKNDRTVYLKAGVALSKHLRAFAEAQLRSISYRTGGTNNDLFGFDLERSLAFFNPRIGLLYRPNPTWSAYLSSTLGQREPARDDYINAPRPTDARPEKLYNTELGFERRTVDHTLALNFFRMYYRDQLVLTGSINDVGEPIRQNVPLSYRHGVELSAGYHPVRRFALSGNVTLSRNRIRGFTEYIDNWSTGAQEPIKHGTTDIAFSPGLIAFGKLDYRLFNHNRFGANLALSMKHISRQFIDNTANNFTVLPAYTVGDLSLSCSLLSSRFDEVTLRLQVNNLLNTRYSANAWTYRYISPGYDARPDDPYARLESGDTYNLTGFYPQAGRHFLVGLSLRL